MSTLENIDTLDLDPVGGCRALMIVATIAFFAVILIAILIVSYAV